MVTHPWATFLTARAEAIDWLFFNQKENDAQIASTLSMDETQVRLIRHRERELDMKIGVIFGNEKKDRDTLENIVQRLHKLHPEIDFNDEGLSTRADTLIDLICATYVRLKK